MLPCWRVCRGRRWICGWKEVHVVLDNLSTHTTPEVQAWLADNPRVRFHFTPKGSSWINQIETWFGIITASPSDVNPSPASRP
jgi:transposase